MGDALRSSAQQAFLDDGHRVHGGQGLFSVNAVEINSGGTYSVKTQLHIQVMDPQTIQDVDEFVSSSDLEKCSFHLRSPMDALLRLKRESKQLIITSQ